jgi:meiosis induction protein kinase IME2/SME1
MTPIDFSSLFDLRIVPLQLVDCIFLLLRFDPKLRISTQQCLQHPYFHDIAARLHPLPTLPQPVLPPTPTSINQVHGSSYPISNPVAMISPPHSAQHGHLDSMTGRSVPPSHSHGTPAPAPEYAHSTYSYRSRSSTASSHHSAAALAGIPVYGPHAPGTASTSHSDPYDAARRQSVPLSVFSGDQQHPSWPSPPPGHHFAAGPLPVPAFRQPRLSTAVSTFYDGSIFEGIAPTREASIMSFNMYGGGRQEPTAASAYAQQYRQAPAGPGPARTVYDDDVSVRHQPYASTSSRLPSSQSMPTLPGSSHLKRTPSERSQADVPAAAPLAPKDAKKAKKEADKAKKEAEKAQREAQQQAMRDRARRVTSKRNDLQQASDPLNQHRATAKKAMEVDAKGKGRAPLPHIAEDGASFMAATPAMSMSSRLLSPDARFRARRRGEDDDDVHSVSSGETHASGYEPRRSVSTANTFDSDPGPPRSAWPPHLARAPSMASLGSQNSGSHMQSHLHLAGPPPGSSSSSVDGQLAQNFQGLSATDAQSWRSSSPMEASGVNGFHSFPQPPANGRSPALPYLPRAFEAPWPFHSLIQDEQRWPTRRQSRRGRSPPTSSHRNHRAPDKPDRIAYSC